MPNTTTDFFLSKNSEKDFSTYLSSLLKEFSDVIILTDQNCNKLCLPSFLDNFPILSKAKVLTISPLEVNKNLETCIHIWEQLTIHCADRKALLINLGGGFVSDIGGFCASVYKRGIHYINVPTTLLSQVDASIGGKTGVNFLGNKNLLGTFQLPIAVFIYADFLTTLPDRDLKSGLAEMLKHALIFDRNYWKKLSSSSLDTVETISEFVPASIRIKQEFVVMDPKDLNDRKKLNFGHTIGHAVESLHMDDESSLLHGEAIAIGLICESFLSFKHSNLDHEELDEICSCVLDHFPSIHIPTGDYHRLIQLMQNDKKNTGKKINFTLLSSIGSSTINSEIPADGIIDALQFYNEKTSLRVANK